MRALSMSVQPITVAAGWRAAICLLKFGPETAANRWVGRSSASQTTWSMRLPVLFSMPFISETMSAESGMSPLNSSSAPRAYCAAMATTTTSACATASARSPVAFILSGSFSTLGRRTGFLCSVWIAFTISGSIAHIITSLPASAST